MNYLSYNPDMAELDGKKPSITDGIIQTVSCLTHTEIEFGAD